MFQKKSINFYGAIQNSFCFCHRLDTTSTKYNYLSDLYKNDTNNTSDSN